MTTLDCNPANASISHRTYFYPLPYPLPVGTPIPYSTGLPKRNPLNLLSTPVEPTSSLVLTSTSKRFVDVRVFKPAVGESELPNEGGPRTRLDWAFSGISSSHATPDPHPSGKITPPDASPPSQPRTWPAPITHATWTHWLDSRHHVSTPAADMPVDQGIMYPLDTSQTLEFGQGINPDTGAMWAYEELWTDGAILAAPTREDAEQLVHSIVLVLEDAENAVRGVVVRLGRYCQGVVMIGGYVSVERWEWVADDDDEGLVNDEEGVDGEKESAGEKGGEKDVVVVVGQWKRTVKIGDQFLPCAATFRPGLLGEGAKLRYGDYEWVCEEKVAWRDNSEEDAGVQEE